VKAGLKTTELWLTIATNVGIVASALAGALTPKWAAVAAAVATASYSIARGLAKAPVATVPVAVVTQPPSSSS
jgi:hypothetical protein